MTIIIDYRTGADSIETLERLGCNIIKTKPLGKVYPEINGHPDIQIHKAGDKLICAPEVYEYYRKLMPDRDIICGSAQLSDKYPYDIAYNVCRIGDFAVCNIRYTAQEILSEYERMGIKPINTRQGYAACSICRVSDNAVITADNGIIRLLSGTGIDVLGISPGNIDLYGMEGFIGGASGLIKQDLLIFNGSVDTHRDGEKIKMFCKKHNTEIIELHTGRLTDIGGILAV